MRGHHRPALLVIDGALATSELALDALAPSDVSTVTYLSSLQSHIRYGHDAGAIIVTTRLR